MASSSEFSNVMHGWSFVTSRVQLTQLYLCAYNYLIYGQCKVAVLLEPNDLWA